MGLMESVLESKLNPITAIAKSGLGMSSFLNKFDKKVELLDDMADHWCVRTCIFSLRFDRVSNKVSW